MSALPPKADILRGSSDVRQVPKGDVATFMSGTIIGARSHAPKRVHDLARMGLAREASTLRLPLIITPATRPC